jgi:hypothetical protein
MDYGGNEGQVQGAVVAWGKMIEHKEGFRAEWAQPIFIFKPRNTTENTERYRLAHRVAKFLRLPLVPFDKDAIKAVAREYGDMME